jgi:transposase
MLHKARDLLVRQQTMLSNAIRGHMAELGMIAPQGSAKIKELIAVIQDSEDQSVPALARAALQPLVHQMQSLDGQVEALDREIMAWHKTNETSRRLATIPGIGFITASAIAATVLDASFFKSGREFAAWLGLTPRQNSSGSKERLGRISKKGNTYIRRFSSPAPLQCCAMRAQRRRLEPLGSMVFSSGARRGWLRLQWPTRLLGSHGQ